MRDFIRFFRWFRHLFWVCRGVLLMILAFVLGCALITHLVERMSFLDALYMDLITALTIGYGDLTPVTAIGKITSVAVGFIGLVFIGLVVAIATVSLRNTVSRETFKRPQ